MESTGDFVSIVAVDDTEELLVRMLEGEYSADNVSEFTPLDDAVPVEDAVEDNEVTPESEARPDATGDEEPTLLLERGEPEGCEAVADMDEVKEERGENDVDTESVDREEATDERLEVNDATADSDAVSEADA